MKKTLKNLKKGLIVSVALLSISVCMSAQANLLQDIEERGVIRVAVTQDFPPLCSAGTDLRPRG